MILDCSFFLFFFLSSRVLIGTNFR